MQTDTSTVKRKLIDIVRSYQLLLERVNEYLHQELEHPEVATYLGLSPTNYYIKRRGDRRFTYQDVELVLKRFGTPDELTLYCTFIDVRDKLFDCLQESPVPLIQYRRILGLQHYRELARRRDHPDTWRIEDMEIVGHYMESIAYCIP